MEEQIIEVGKEVVIQEDSPQGRFSAVFKDNGEAGYFYALDLSQTGDKIVDAVQVYNVASLVDRACPSALLIVWSQDGTKCGLLVNSFPRAVFDFAAKRGYGRSSFPISPSSNPARWSGDHRWSEDAVVWLKAEGKLG